MGRGKPKDGSKNPGGAPPKFKSDTELQSKINEYFDYCDNKISQIYSPKQDAVLEVINPEPYTLEGLAYFCGFASRQSITDYENRDEKFSYIIKRARLKVQNGWSVGSMEGKNAAGYIFQLKNNAGYKDSQEIDLNVNDAADALKTARERAKDHIKE